MIVALVPYTYRIYIYFFLMVSPICRCYCILHEENVLGAIFSLWKELKVAKSWEEVEETVWGELNNYDGFC